MREIHWHKESQKAPNALLCVNGGFKDRKDVAVAEGKRRRGNNNAGGGQTVLAACVIIVYITVCTVAVSSYCHPLYKGFFVFLPES